MISLAKIESEVKRLASIIGAKGFVLPTFGHTQDFARPHIEVDAGGLHWVVVERGVERKRITTDSLDDLLFCIFKSVTHCLASDFELKHRIGNQDCRKILFRRQVELLSLLSPSWAARAARNHEEILKEHPFHDDVT